MYIGCAMSDNLKNERNYGIDLLRITAMIMVCIIHINLFAKAHTELIEGREYFYYFGTWTETVGYIGVNLYALITGYVCVQSSWKFSRYVRLWCLVAFYTIGLLALGGILSLSGVLPWEITVKRGLRIILRLCCGSSYWYFAAYTGLFFLMPFINPVLRQAKQGILLLLVAVLLGMIPIWNILSASTMYSGGYNMTWLIALYIGGAYVRLYPPKWHNKRVLLTIAFLCTMQPVSCCYFGIPAYMSYVSPVMIIYSLALFLLFFRIRVTNKCLQLLIRWAAPLSFSVYLIHVHPWTWKMLSHYIFELNVDLDYPWWIALGGGLLMYILCSCIDQLRLWLFNLCRINTFADYVAGIIENIVRTVCGRVPVDK